MGVARSAGYGRFLGLALAPPAKLHRKNQHRTYKSRFLQQFLVNPPPIVVKALRAARVTPTAGAGVAPAVDHAPGLRTVVWPGADNARGGGVCGPETAAFLSRFHAGKAFIGAGISYRRAQSIAATAAAARPRARSSCAGAKSFCASAKAFCAGARSFCASAKGSVTFRL